MRKISTLAFTISAIIFIPSPLRAQTPLAESAKLQVAKPFGVELGKTTCRQAAAALKMHLLNIDSPPVSAQVNPEGYPGEPVFSIRCEKGADAPVSSASLVILGGTSEYDMAVSDLASKYKKNGSKKLGGVAGIEFLARNGTIMFYAMKTNQTDFKELLIEIRYNSFESLALEKNIEQSKNDEVRAKEKSRRSVL